MNEPYKTIALILRIITLFVWSFLLIMSLIIDSDLLFTIICAWQVGILLTTFFIGKENGELK